MTLAAAVMAFFVGWGMSAWMASHRSPLRILDKPNDRSLHIHPTPRTGGVAILTGVALAWGMVMLSAPADAVSIAVVASALLVAAISFIDDLAGVSPILRLLIHGLAAAVLLAAGIAPDQSWWGLALGWFVIVWVINLYNFMDGMDGFAAGMGASGFGFLALAGWLAGDHLFASLSLAVAAANGGFLVCNFPPARIFMGDTGSATMGLLAVALSLWGIHENLFPFWLPVLIFSPFITDATVTLVRRGIQGDKIWRPHRTHYYQRLVQRGWGHKKTVLAEYLLMLAAGVTAIVLRNVSPGVLWFGITLWALLFAGIVFAVHRLERTEKGHRKGT